ncbi:MAG: SRPBCC family protein [Oligoflexia bacterium]|nr:SRPBCC family protein [Oligoflexia bacterium]
MAHFEFSSVLPFPRADVFEFSTDPENLSKIMVDFKIEATSPITKLKKGIEYEMRISRFGISVIWGVVIEELIQNELFRDRQSHGPFSLWVHTHKFEDHGHGTLLTELIEYDLAFGILGKLADDLFIKRELQKLFESRHAKTLELLTQVKNKKNK